MFDIHDRYVSADEVSNKFVFVRKAYYLLNELVLSDSKGNATYTEKELWKNHRSVFTRRNVLNF